MNSRELHALIRSLSPPEVRYIQRYASRHRGDSARYLQLFKALQGLNKFAESELRSRVAQDIPAEKLGSARHYLGRIILRALREYNYQATSSARFRALTDDIEILVARGLMKAARKTIEKGMREARESGDPHALMSFLRWHRRWLRGSKDAGTEDYDQLLQLESETQKSIAEELTAIQEYDRVFSLVRRRLVSDQQIDFKLVTPPKGTFDGAIAFFSAKAILAKLENRPDDALSNFKHNLDTWIAHPSRILDHPNRYASAISNFLAACHFADQYEAFQAGLIAIGQVSVPKAQQLRIAALRLNFQLLFAANRGNWDRVKEIELEVEGILGEATLPVTLELDLRYNIWAALFYHGDYKAAYKWLRTLLDRSTSDERKDIQDLARILEPIHLYIEGEWTLLPYRIRSAKRFLQGRSGFPKWFNGLLKALEGKNEKMVRSRLSPLVSEIQNSPDSLGRNELLHWVSKVIGDA